MAFIMNNWYIGALSHEVTPASLFNRTLLEQPVLFMRDDQGVVTAMSDRCAHRFAPLHLGKRVGNTIACPYHGLTFDTSGRCVFSPHSDGHIPPRARLKTFNCVERHGCIWIWMGDQARADQSLIPEYSDTTAGSPHGYFDGYLHSQANYQLLVDNILDLSHSDFLHPTLLAAGGGVTQQRPQVTEQQRGFRVTWEWNEKPPMGVFAPGLPGVSVTDGWLWVEWQPVGLMKLHSGVTASGSPRQEGVSLTAYHCMTPETPMTTHYFYSIRRDYCVDEGTNAFMAKATRAAFSTEDKPMIEAVQKYMGTADFWSLKPAIVSSDLGGLRARRATERLLHEEVGDTPAAAAEAAERNYTLADMNTAE